MSPVPPAAIALLLASCATLPTRAHAGPPSPDSVWDEPAVEPGEGSLWDHIEGALDGQPPTKEVVDASGELAAERSAALDFLEVVQGQGLEESFAWYRDPHGYLTKDPLFLDRLDPEEFDLPLVLNDQVELWMRYFLGSGRVWFARYLARSTRYRGMIEAGLTERDMPQDLFYLAMIESGFSTHAYSRASAVGLWQFMSPTARAYKLRVEWWVDERRDPELATSAALDHLQDLHEMFGDWYLATAAYNAGAGRVRGAIKKSGGTDYWSVAKPGFMARETCNYVPKLIAAAIIGHNPQRYGFTDIDYQPPLSYDTVVVPHSSSVEALAGCAQVGEERFQELNPALRRWAVPPEPDSYAVRVPLGSAESFSSCIERIPPSERVSFMRHRVRSGESLGSIATHYGVSVDAIVRLNDIRNRNRIYVGTELVIPAPGAKGGDASTGSANQAQATGSTAAEPRAITSHTVRTGENLAAIATRYGVTLADLQAWNDIGNPDQIKAGQRIRVGAGTPTGSNAVTYTVKPGDTLSGIAAHFDVSSSDLRRWNDVSDPSRIDVGDKLTIHTNAVGWIVYMVRTGDTLGSIARSQGCSVTDIKTWNSLSSTTIHPGQQLRIQR